MHGRSRSRIRPVPPLRSRSSRSKTARSTSTRLRRRWLVDGVEHHHLIDPRTGGSAFSGWAQVSVIAGTATEAEVLVKALFLAGPERRDLLDEHGARAVLIGDDGHVETMGFDDQPFNCTPM